MIKINKCIDFLKDETILLTKLLLLYMTWNVEFEKEKGVDNSSYLQSFMKQAPNKISGLTLLGESVKSYCANSSYWSNYKDWYTTPKFESQAATMDIDMLCEIHNNSNHGMSGAESRTEDAVYNMYKNSTDEGIPLTPFVLIPEEYYYLTEEDEQLCPYKIEREGRSRLSGVKKARDNGLFSGPIPVLFAIRQARR